MIGNLFYRGLVLRRAGAVGDTLHTTTEVVALRRPRRARRGPRPGSPCCGSAPATRTSRRVLDFWRCAMLPLRDPRRRTGHADDLATIAAELDARRSARGHRRLGSRPRCAPRRRAAFAELRAGRRARRSRRARRVTAAPELARLTLNIAARTPTPRQRARPAAGLRRARHRRSPPRTPRARCPTSLTILAWDSCDHLGPVFEGDTLPRRSSSSASSRWRSAAALVHLRARVRARRDERARDVLDWRLVGVLP